MATKKTGPQVADRVLVEAVITRVGEPKAEGEAPEVTVRLSSNGHLETMRSGWRVDTQREDA